MREDVVHLDDFIYRRSTIGKLGRLTPDGLNELRAVIANALGWDDFTSEEEMQRFMKLQKTKHRLIFNQFI
ncbi:MAG: hypothetical protein P1P76_06130 [Anaerolineales bacterium]|nr:hypothetical protein [Anaerolineales bacterium]